MTSYTRWLKLLLVAVVLPVAITVLDREAYRFADQRHWSVESSLLVYGLFIAQTALLCWAAGRLLDQWAWRVIVVGWVLAMVNGQLPIPQSTVWGVTTPLLVYAFLSAQFGALALCGVLGSWSWPLRLPAVALAALPLVLLIPPDEYRARAWVSLLVVQTISLIVLLLALWMAGYRLRASHETQVTGRGVARSFTISHLLGWTAAAALLLGVLRVTQPLLGTFGAGRWLHTGMFGVCCALVTLAAIWSTLGEGRWYVRAAVFLIWPPLCGAAIWWLVDAFLQTESGNYLSWYMGGLDALWLVWTTLAAAFLAALLLLARTTGYRLTPRPASLQP